MNFSSFKYFAFKQAKFSFNKSSFKMMSSSMNNSNCRFVSLFSNKVHFTDRIRALNNITKRGICGKIASGNGMNILNDPQISLDSIKASSIIGDPLSSYGIRMAGNCYGLIFLNDYLLLSDGNFIFYLFRAALHDRQSIKFSGNNLGQII
jgi:hypothetical protein